MKQKGRVRGKVGGGGGEGGKSTREGMRRKGESKDK